MIIGGTAPVEIGDPEVEGSGGLAEFDIRGTETSPVLDTIGLIGSKELEGCRPSVFVG